MGCWVRTFVKERRVSYRYIGGIFPEICPKFTNNYVASYMSTLFFAHGNSGNVRVSLGSMYYSRSTRRILRTNLPAQYIYTTITTEDQTATSVTGYSSFGIPEESTPRAEQTHTGHAHHVRGCTRRLLSKEQQWCRHRRHHPSSVIFYAYFFFSSGVKNV